jgi:hypothetical protein
VRFALACLMVAAVLLAPGGQAIAVNEQHRKECQFNGLDAGEWTQREEYRTARCVQNRWHVPGGLTQLLQVGRCESGFYRFAYNPGGPYVGIFQHDLHAWPRRVDKYQPDWWELRRGWANPRSQLVVTVRMVRAEGWGPWSCA